TNLLGRKLGHFFNPRQRGHGAGRTGTPMLIIRHDDDGIAGVSESGEIEGPCPVAIWPILGLPGDGNGQRLAAGVDFSAHLGDERAERPRSFGGTFSRSRFTPSYW